MRNIKNINKGWLFLKSAEVPSVLPVGAKEVDLPYTWNGTDGQDGGNDYYRGKCCFAKELSKEDLPAGECIYLQFDGVNSSAEVYLNGEKIAAHDGGYSTFRAELKNLQETNLLIVTADNSPSETVYPQQADFTFYGGIYRDVTLIGVPKKHFDLDYYGAPGIAVTPRPEGTGATIDATAYTDGCVRFDITDNGKIIASETADGVNPAVSIKLNEVHLWNGVKDPYLYTITATLLEGGEEIDAVSTRFGVRSFKIDPEKGFILNGREYPLHGVARHQDRPGKGNAISPEDHAEDIKLILEMGANTVRLAHYQHSQIFYDLCDEAGLVVWAEIPYISRNMPTGRDNTVSQLKELIYQNYNHPSIVVWGISNEITMSGGAKDEDLIENHQILNDLAHSIDPTRPTTLAVLSTCPIDEKYVHITDVISYNHYFGWYGGNFNTFGEWFDKFHKKYPERAIGLSEYGAEALNWHSPSPEQGDYTEEYQALFHEEVIKQLAKRPYIWATHVWNMFDFAADARAEGGENGMNHKGLVTFDRKYKKDAFYAYKAWLSDEPFVHICSKRYIERTEEKTEVKVYTNVAPVELFVNGKSVGVQERKEFPFYKFTIDNTGESNIVAKAGNCEDTAIIKKVSTPNKDYIMQAEGDVINWFEIDTPSGYYSINDTVGDIMKSPRGVVFLLSLVSPLLKMMGGSSEKKQDDEEESEGEKKKDKKKKGGGLTVAGFTVSPEMLKMVGGFTIRRGLTMLGGFTKEQLLDYNRRLNKIKKPKKQR